MVEAQQAGVPVACLTSGSLPEVAGQGAAYFDPNSASAMASVMRRCLTHTKYKADLHILGKENLKRFSWEKTADMTLAVYHRVLSHK